MGLVFVSTLILYYLWKPFGDFYKGRKLPPGPIRWPILGSLPQMMMVDKVYPFRQLSALSNTYGNIMSLGFGVHYAVVLSSYEIMKDILKRPEATLQRFRFQFIDQRTNEKNLGFAWSFGETWKQVRAYSVRTLKDFGFGKKGSLEEAAREEVDALMKDMREQSEKNGGVWSVDSHRFSMVPINILWSCVGGYRFDPSSPMVQRHIQLTTETCEMLRPTNLLSVFPFLKYFSNLSGYKRHGEIHERSRNFMKDLIQDVKGRRQGREEPESFIEMFLDEIEKGKNVPDSVMTEEQLETVLMDLFLAGTETTSTVMNWLVLYLVLNQNVQDKARAEIMNMSGGGASRIPLSALNKMPYVKALIYETMRLSPFGALPPPREASEDIVYGDYIIPKGACILFNLYPGFHDHKFWGDAEVFRPERFFDESGTQLDASKVERIVQFGIGRRVCPGEAMAIDTLFEFAVTLLSTFSVGLVKGKEATAEPGTAALTICPMPYVVTLKPLH